MMENNNKVIKMLNVCFMLDLIISVFDFKIFDVFISVCKTHLDAECVPG